MKNIATMIKFSELESVSNIEDNYSSTLVIILFSLQLKRKTIIFFCQSNWI